MSFANPYLDNDFLTAGVITRRCVAWVFDVFLIAVLVCVLWWILVAFGVLTFGLGFSAMSLLPLVPFFYHFLSLLGSSSATPGQQMTGLAGCRYGPEPAGTASRSSAFCVTPRWSGSEASR